MARGWESKAVEGQIEDARSRRAPQSKGDLTEAAAERERRKRALLMERTRLRGEIERGQKPGYLELLKRGLEHVETELAKLERDA